jgi:Asp-tRNA(Asn)/Glu-tRNA(Gln) amidotransferase A subunit family amidase
MITSLSASELARRIRERALSPIEVVEAHIARIVALHPTLNAVVTPTFDQARHESCMASDAVERGEPLGPLHGVPFTAKDCLDVAGVRSTAGLVSRAGHVAAGDAVVVARLRAAGAILLGKTNTPDNCWDQETDNLLFGRTNNPWDVARTVGGSSGGEAAIIAAGGSPLGIGTDIAGSIRMPAHFTGVVGLRPTSARLSEQGNWPPPVGRLADLEAIGPMARRVEDVALAFDIMAGVEPAPLDLGALRGERVAYWFDDGLIPSSGAIKGGVRAAVGALERAGMVPVAGAPRSRVMAVLGWLAYHGATERRAVAEGFGDGAAWSPLAEMVHALRGQPRVASGALMYWLASHYGSLLARAVGVDGARWRADLRAEFLDLVGERGVAVCPIFPTSAPRHGWTRRALMLTLTYQAWVNLAGLPGLTAPVGRSGHGLPVGVQIVGAPGAERTLLAAGLAVQNTLMPEWRGPVL